MKTSGIPIKGGFRARDTKDGRVVLEKIKGYGLSASAKIAKRKEAQKPRLKRGK